MIELQVNRYIQYNSTTIIAVKGHGEIAFSVSMSKISGVNKVSK